MDTQKPQNNRLALLRVLSTNTILLRVCASLSQLWQIHSLGQNIAKSQLHTREAPYGRVINPANTFGTHYHVAVSAQQYRRNPPINNLLPLFK